MKNTTENLRVWWFTFFRLFRLVYSVKEKRTTTKETKPTLRIHTPEGEKIHELLRKNQSSWKGKKGKSESLAHLDLDDISESVSYAKPTYKTTKRNRVSRFYWSLRSYFQPLTWSLRERSAKICCHFGFQSAQLIKLNSSIPGAWSKIFFIQSNLGRVCQISWISLNKRFFEIDF